MCGLCRQSYRCRQVWTGRQAGAGGVHADRTASSGWVRDWTCSTVLGTRGVLQRSGCAGSQWDVTAGCETAKLRNTECRKSRIGFCGAGAAGRTGRARARWLQHRPEAQRQVVQQPALRPRAPRYAWSAFLLCFGATPVAPALALALARLVPTQPARFLSRSPLLSQPYHPHRPHPPPPPEALANSGLPPTPPLAP